MKDHRHAIGFMSGTSLDGLDAAAIRASGSGSDLEVEILTHVETTFDGDDPQIVDLRAFARGGAATAARIAEITHELGRRHACLLRKVAEESGLDLRKDLDLIALHGQTITHRPPISWQLVDPWPVTLEVACPVVCDLRGADLASGGRGAPITPLADAILFRDHRTADQTSLILNLGGFANATLLPGKDGEPIGFDCCPCNHLLDAASRVALDTPFDLDGRATASGRVDEKIVTPLVDLIATLAREARSGGDGDEHAEAARSIAAEALAAGHPENGLASIGAAIARSIATIIQQRLDTHGCPPLGRTFVAGGGVRNQGLFAAIDGALKTSSQVPPGPVESSSTAGIPPQAREAAAMAVLGLLAADDDSITTPSSTGRRPSGIPDGLWTRSSSLR